VVQTKTLPVFDATEMTSLRALTALLTRVGAVQLFVLAVWFAAAVILARPWLAQEGIGEVEDGT
jgi:hypothetical protein